MIDKWRILIQNLGQKLQEKCKRTGLGFIELNHQELNVNAISKMIKQGCNYIQR